VKRTTPLAVQFFSAKPVPSLAPNVDLRSQRALRERLNDLSKSSHARLLKSDAARTNLTVLQNSQRFIRLSGAQFARTNSRCISLNRLLRKLPRFIFVCHSTPRNTTALLSCYFVDESLRYFSVSSLFEHSFRVIKLFINPSVVPSCLLRRSLLSVPAVSTPLCA
jgi:hypothetical protein